MATRFETVCCDNGLSLSAGNFCDFSPGASQKAICVRVVNSFFPAFSSSNRLVDFGPAPSFREPASVGLNASAQNGPFSPQSNEQADCNCRP